MSMNRGSLDPLSMGSLGQLAYNALPWKAKILKVGSYAHVYKQNGAFLISRSSLSQAILDAKGLLSSGRTARENILVDGAFDWDAGFSLNSHTGIGVLGKWTKTFNGNGIVNATPAGVDEDIAIFGVNGKGIIDCNSKTGKGIYYAVASAPTMHNTAIFLKDLSVYSATDGAIEFDCYPASSVPFILENVDANSVNKDGLRLRYCTEGLVKGGSFSSYDTTGSYHGIRIKDAGQDLHIKPHSVECKKGSGVWLTGTNIEFSCQFIDGSWTNGVAGNFIELQHLLYASIHDINMRANNISGITGNTLDGIAMIVGGSGVKYCNFNNIYAGRQGGSGYTLKYAIEENATDCDYNSYNNIISIVGDCASGTLRQLGANGKPRVNPAQGIVGTVVLT